MHVQHDANRRLFRVLEDRLQDLHHELHGRVVVIMQEDLVELRPLELLLGLALDDQLALSLSLTTLSLGGAHTDLTRFARAMPPAPGCGRAPPTRRIAGRG